MTKEEAPWSLFCRKGLMVDHLLVPYPTLTLFGMGSFRPKMCTVTKKSIKSNVKSFIQTKYILFWWIWRMVITWLVKIAQSEILFISILKNEKKHRVRCNQPKSYRIGLIFAYYFWISNESSQGAYRCTYRCCQHLPICLVFYYLILFKLISIKCYHSSPYITSIGTTHFI